MPGLHNKKHRRCNTSFDRTPERIKCWNRKPKRKGLMIKNILFPRCFAGMCYKNRFNSWHKKNACMQDITRHMYFVPHLECPFYISRSNAESHSFVSDSERKSRNKFTWTSQIRGSRTCPFWFPTAPRLLLASSNIPPSALILSHSRLTDPKSTQQRKSSIRNTLTNTKSHVTRSSSYLPHVASIYFNSPKLGFDPF
jgi:hypothetical protein